MRRFLTNRGIWLRASFLLLAMVVVTGSLLSGAPVNVGDEYGGGKVVYVLHPGDPGFKAGEDHGLIAAKDDLPEESLTWSEAKAAAERLELSGYKGWSLPSQDDLALLYQNQAVVGGFRDYSYYWSGSEIDKQKAWSIDFYNGEKVVSVKSGTLTGIRRIRPVRKF